jgi:hypothetical protein
MPSSTTRRTKSDPPTHQIRAYQRALRVIAVHWGAGPHPPEYRMPADVLEAYRTVGRFAGRYHAPRHGVAHPKKSTKHRLKAFLALHPALPRGVQLVTRRTVAGSRSWSSAWLELPAPGAPGVVHRYRPGLRQPMISIRGTARGRASLALNPCPWRPLSQKEASSLPPCVIAFLDALQPSWRASR